MYRIHIVRTLDTGGVKEYFLPKYRYLTWNNIGTVKNAQADYV